MEKYKYASKINSVDVWVVDGQECYSLQKELRSHHEETDTRFTLHVKNAAEKYIPGVAS